VKSALVCRFAAGTKHGMDRASAREPLAARFYDVRHLVPRGLHAVERNRRLTAAALGYELDARCDYGLRINGAAPGSPYAVLLTMTSRADKLWPEARWVELARALGTPVLLPWGSEAERSRAERIAAGVGSAKVPERMSLGELGKLFSGARAVVGLDTGLTHLAAALGAATVGIYCASDPALTGIYGAARARNVGAPGRIPEVADVLKSLA
jgi:heptosyltransferase-1